MVSFSSPRKIQVILWENISLKEMFNYGNYIMGNGYINNNMGIIYIINKDIKLLLSVEE